MNNVRQQMSVFARCLPSWRVMGIGALIAGVLTVSMLAGATIGNGAPKAFAGVTPCSGAASTGPIADLMCGSFNRTFTCQVIECSSSGNVVTVTGGGFTGTLTCTAIGGFLQNCAGRILGVGPNPINSGWTFTVTTGDGGINPGTEVVTCS